jgi:hypothetical protein
VAWHLLPIRRARMGAIEGTVAVARKGTDAKCGARLHPKQRKREFGFGIWNLVELGVRPRLSAFTNVSCAQITASGAVRLRCAMDIANNRNNRALTPITHADTDYSALTPITGHRLLPITAPISADERLSPLGIRIGDLPATPPTRPRRSSIPHRAQF